MYRSKLYFLYSCRGERQPLIIRESAVKIYDSSSLAPVSPASSHLFLSISSVTLIYFRRYWTGPPNGIPQIAGIDRGCRVERARSRCALINSIYSDYDGRSTEGARNTNGNRKEKRVKREGYLRTIVRLLLSELLKDALSRILCESCDFHRLIDLTSKIINGMP